MNFGVLALQGDFEAHRRALAEAGVPSTLVRTAAELAAVDALAMPGGESTTMLKLLEEDGLFEPLRAFAASRPVLATCAGVILLARRTLSPSQNSLGVLDATVERNAYGRQLDSAIRRLTPEPERRDELGAEPVEAVFIRAPIVRETGPGVEVLLREGENPVLLRQGRLLAATFHPELSADRRIHRMFVEAARAGTGATA